MRRIAPTRGLRVALVGAAVVVCAAGAAGQARHGGRTAGFRESGRSYSSPVEPYRGAAPGYRGAAPAYRGTGAPMDEPRAQQPYMAQPMREGQSPAPIERRPPPQSSESSQLAQMERRNSLRPGAPHGEHLAEWMNQHRNLTPEQQQQALGREPGFHDLPQQTQQRMRNQLARLDSMPPEERQRILAHNEWMEHLSVPQRAEVRGSLEQLGALPPDQRREVARSFRQLRMIPPEQRGAALNSPEFQYMNPAQRAALNHLLQVEPLLPPD